MNKLKADSVRQKLIKLVTEIIKRPAMFSVQNVGDIYFVTFGYRVGVGSEYSELISDFLHDFRCYVNKKFGKTDEYMWHELIELKTSTDAESLALFSNLFEEFINVS